MIDVSKICVRIVAPECSRVCFTVSVCGECENYKQSESVFGNGKAEFSVPAGKYTVRVRANAPISPGGQCKWIDLGAGQNAGFTAVFGEPPGQCAAVVDFTLQDDHYPDIIPINGGIVVMAGSAKTITFNNGVATGVTLPVGTYQLVSSSIPGYEDATIPPFTITKDTQKVVLRISANGQLVVTVVDEADDPITAGSLRLSNASGTTPHGNAVDISNGKAVFRNVPYSPTAGTNLWVSQPESDENHDPIDAPQEKRMFSSMEQLTIVNERKSVAVNMEMIDANYPGVAALTGDIIVSG